MAAMLNGVLSLLMLASLAAAEHVISATGGGVVKPGDDLVLTLDVGEKWDRCFWFWYSHDSEVSYCSFDMDPETSEVKKHLCKPPEVGEQMKYTGTSETQCTITIADVNERENCTWASRLGSDLAPINIDVVVAVEVTEVVVEVHDDDEDDGLTLTTGNPGQLVCRSVGGRPQPQLELLIDGEPQDGAEVSSVKVDEQGFYTVELTLNVTEVGAELDNAKVGCKVVQTNKEGLKLFEDKLAEEKELDVLFAPVPYVNATESKPGKKKKAVGVKGDDIEVEFVVNSNPKPNKVQWQISEGNDTKTVKMGEDGDKYKASNVEIKDEKERLYDVKLVIKELEEKDADKEYEAIVFNDVGNITLPFELKVKKNINDTITDGDDDDDDDDDEGASTSLVIGSVAIVACLLVAVIGAVCIVKRKRAKTEAAPLASMERQQRR